MPLVQFLCLRRELPYPRLLLDTALYALCGLVMLLLVRLTGRLLPFGGWGALAVQVAAGVVCYAGLCLLLWRVTGDRAVPDALRRHSPER